MKVLIVDDDPDICYVLSTALTEWGYRCATAEDTARALELLGSEHFDVMVLDLLMPSVRGDEFLIWLHGLLAPGDMPRVVILTGYVPDQGPNQPDVTADTAVAGVVRKPFGLDELQSAVRAAANSE